MNDPWLTLIKSLSGTAPVAPAQWPTRRVYRMIDDLPTVRLASRPPVPLRPLMLTDGGTGAARRRR